MLKNQPTKHTPGPWSAGVYETTESFRKIDIHSCVCDPVTMALIATTGPAHDRQSQIDADLMAAAPDLLRVANKALEFIDLIMAKAEEIPTEILSGAVKNGQEIQGAIAKALISQQYTTTDEEAFDWMPKTHLRGDR